MKLHYRILWIDDNIEEVISVGVKDDIQTHVESLEFITTIDCFETSSLAEEKIQSGTVNYDLIISDYNIEEGGDQGDVLIKKIRGYDIFTEVLFYSAEPNFNQSTIGVDRISYFSLQGDEGYRGFKQKVINLIDQTVYKLQELPSIRGLVMTETSILDSIIEKILFDYFDVENDETKKLKSEITDKISESLKSNFNAQGQLKLASKSAKEVVKSRIFDASKKARTIENLIGIKGFGGQETYQNFYENYFRDVIEVRNKLAHAKSEVIDGVECLVVDGDEPEKYDLERCKAIRKNLRKYSALLLDLHGKFANNK